MSNKEELTALLKELETFEINLHYVVARWHGGECDSSDASYNEGFADGLVCAYQEIVDEGLYADLSAIKQAIKDMLTDIDRAAIKPEAGQLPLFEEIES